MNTYLIRIDGKAYLGEDPNNTYAAGYQWNGSFHTRPSELNILMVGRKTDQPKSVVGTRGLRSEMDRIVRRIEDGLIDCSEITILCVKSHGAAK